MNLPKITIVTPSYNQGAFLDETIQSVLDQKYPNLEYFIVDGGSRDNSVEVIKKYEKHITWWVSEKDRGQPHALNKGFERATGDVYGFINSDDCLLPGALNYVGRQFAADASLRWLVGWVLFVEQDDQNFPQVWHAYERHKDWFVTNPIGQQGTFWTGALHRQLGGFREEYDLAFDYDFWMRMRFVAGARPKVFRRCLGTYRMHAASKTVTQHALKMRPEYERIRAECLRTLPAADQQEVLEFRREFDTEKHRVAGWRALQATDLTGAREHAAEALRLAPTSPESWRLWLCTKREQFRAANREATEGPSGNGTGHGTPAAPAPRAS
jgi:hypothetical protein